MDTTLRWKSTHGTIGPPLLIALHTDADDTTDQATHHIEATVLLRRAVMKLLLRTTVEDTGPHAAIIAARAVTRPVVTATDVTTAETKMSRLLLVVIAISITIIANEVTSTTDTILTTAPIECIPMDTTTSIVIVITRMITMLLIRSRHSCDRRLLDACQCLPSLDWKVLRCSRIVSIVDAACNPKFA